MKRMNGWCPFGKKCRNPKCNCVQPGAEERPSCTKQQMYRMRVQRRDARDCKFRDYCHNIECVFNHPERSFCPVEDDCVEPECPSNHQVLLCRNGLHGSQCSNKICEFRHADKIEVPSEGSHEAKKHKAGFSRQTSLVPLVCSATKAEPMVRLVDFWIPQIPNWIVDLLYDQILVPKFKQALEEYPTNSISLRSWAVPWILPFMTLFSKGSMETFLVKNIVPKLQQAMQQLVINPLDQVLEPWNWVMMWVDIVPVKSIVDILESAFFPQWLQFLNAWLDQLRHNYEDIFRWYLWWLGLINEKLLQHPKVRHNLQKGLKMIGDFVHRTQVSLFTRKAFRALKITLLQNHGFLLDITSDPWSLGFCATTYNTN